jgi:hypothetical protein
MFSMESWKGYPLITGDSAKKTRVLNVHEKNRRQVTRTIHGGFLAYKFEIVHDNLGSAGGGPAEILPAACPFCGMPSGFAWLEIPAVLPVLSVGFQSIPL